jgi:hypothetical protein
MVIETKNDQELQDALIIVRKKKIKKKLIHSAIIAVIIIATLVMVFIYGYNAAKNKSLNEVAKAQETAEYWKNEYDKLSEIPVVLDPVTPEIVQSVLMENITDISELATSEYNFTNAAKFENTAHIVKAFDWMTKKSFVQKWDGIIKAGVKLDQLEISVIDNVVTITMPSAEILSYEIDYDSVEVLDEKNNVFNPISVDDKVNFDKATEDNMKERAIRNGLLEKAQENAKTTVANLLTASIENIQDYTINFVIVGN